MKRPFTPAVWLQYTYQCEAINCIPYIRTLFIVHEHSIHLYAYTTCVLYIHCLVDTAVLLIVLIAYSPSTKFKVKVSLQFILRVICVIACEQRNIKFSLWTRSLLVTRAFVSPHWLHREINLYLHSANYVHVRYCCLPQAKSQTAPKPVTKKSECFRNCWEYFCT